MDCHGIPTLLLKLFVLATVVPAMKTDNYCENMPCKFGIKFEGDTCKCCIDCSKFNKEKPYSGCSLSAAECGNCLCGYKPKKSFTGFYDTCIKDVTVKDCDNKLPEEVYKFPQTSIIAICVFGAFLPIMGVSIWFGRKAMMKRRQIPSTPDSCEVGRPLLNDTVQSAQIILRPELTNNTQPEAVFVSRPTNDVEEVVCVSSNISPNFLSGKEDETLSKAIPTEGYLNNPAATLNQESIEASAPPLDASDTAEDQIVPSIENEVQAITFLPPPICDSGHSTMETDTMEMECCSDTSMNSFGQASTLPMESAPASLDSENSNDEQNSTNQQSGRKIPVESDISEFGSFEEESASNDMGQCYIECNIEYSIEASFGSLKVSQNN